MSKITYIVTSVLVVLACLFAILNSYVWTGFAYFTLCSLMLLALFWGFLLVYKFFTQYKSELAERFKVYKAEVVNSTGIAAEVFDASEAGYKKEFNKKLRTEKLLKWFYILFCFACAAAFVAGMILM